MVNFALGAYNYNSGSLLPSQAGKAKSSLMKKSKESLPTGVTATDTPGVFMGAGGETLLKQGDSFVAVSNFTGPMGTPTTISAYKPPEPSRVEQIEQKVDAVEEAVGTPSLVMEDLPQPSARLKDEEEARQARRNQLRSFRGQRRSLLRPAARRPYYG